MSDLPLAAPSALGFAIDTDKSYGGAFAALLKLPVPSPSA